MMKFFKKIDRSIELKNFLTFSFRCKTFASARYYSRSRPQTKTTTNADKTESSSQSTRGKPVGFPRRKTVDFPKRKVKKCQVERNGEEEKERRNPTQRKRQNDEMKDGEIEKEMENGSRGGGRRKSLRKIRKFFDNYLIRMRLLFKVPAREKEMET